MLQLGWQQYAFIPSQCEVGNPADTLPSSTLYQT